ncbi:MAG: PH domain-containing protein [Candidatus Micrarchaeota archaeon]|nr:PH domain-containing protein [Candidatus Micrarchaeota archaeon]
MNNAQFSYAYPSVGPYLFGKEIDTILENISQDDGILYVARQKRRSGAVIAPSVVIVTRQRLVIVHRWAAGLKSDITFIPYQNIVSVRIGHGVLFSSVSVRVKGSPTDNEPAQRNTKNEGRANGFSKRDAEAIFFHVNSIVKEYENQVMERHYHVHGDFMNNMHMNQNGTPRDYSIHPQKQYTYDFNDSAEPEPIPEIEMESAYLLTNGTSTDRHSAHAAQQLYLLASGQGNTISINNGNSWHRVTADDLMIFKMRKKIDPNELKIFQERRSAQV